MHPSNRAVADSQPVSAKYCDRCARRSPCLFDDELTRQELCQDCSERLKRRRFTAPTAKKGTMA